MDGILSGQWFTFILMGFLAIAVFDELMGIFRKPDHRKNTSAIEGDSDRDTEIRIAINRMRRALESSELKVYSTEGFVSDRASTRGTEYIHVLVPKSSENDPHSEPSPQPQG
ncbi:hypothetical protein KQI52_15090 [bacterium]|nr:hypothetical protein [bacterium]